MSKKASVARCVLCGEPMPPGEEMFYYHGYSGPCPKPPKAKNEIVLKPDNTFRSFIEQLGKDHGPLTTRDLLLVSAAYIAGRDRGKRT